MYNLSELTYLQNQRNHFHNNNMEAELKAVLIEIENFVPQTSLY
jgi:hypothetical protein